MPICETHLDHIKHRLEDIRDHLFDDRLEIALYHLGYLACYLDDIIEGNLDEDEVV